MLRALCGRGKRSGVYGAFLLAVYDGDGEEYQTISKIGTGFSEEQLKAFSEELEGLKIPGPKPYYRRATGCRDSAVIFGFLMFACCHPSSIDHCVLEGMEAHVLALYANCACACCSAGTVMRGCSSPTSGLKPRPSGRCAPNPLPSC